jgi:hypothetical protein
MKSPQSKLSRRNFLLAAGAGSVVGTAALVANQGREVQPKKQEKAADSKGYRLTEHIQNYYRTTKV